jgi:hypothetical protein
VTLPLEWFRAEAARQGLPLDEEDLQAIAGFVNDARAALDVHRPRETEGLEPSSLPQSRLSDSPDGVLGDEAGR